MTYVISDLHGCYEKYKRMLDMLRFSDNDILYVLGDVVDRGTGGIRILQDMMLHKNVIPLWGNHDYMAYYLLSICYQMKTEKGIALLKELFAEQGTMETGKDIFTEVDLLKTDEYRMWMEIGGEITFRAFQALGRDDQKDILNYMDTFSFYKEIEMNGRKFFLSHTVPDKSKMTAFIDRNRKQVTDSMSGLEYYFIVTMPEYEKVYFEDRYIVTGHTPTGFIDEKYLGKIYQKNQHIAIDCGAVYGAHLGCVCLDTLEEFYA